MERNIGNLVNKFTEEPLFEEIERIKRIRNLVHPPNFILGFGACKRETFDQIVDYMGRILSIPQEHPLENFDLVMLISKGIYDLRDQFKEHIPTWNKLSGDSVLITSTGFEQMPHYIQKSSALQVQGAAHIFTQMIKEDNLSVFTNTRPYYADLNKVVILVTHIGTSVGEERYNYAVIDADRHLRGNRFQDFNFEIKE